MTLSIIIVNWNSGGLLKRCLNSIYNHTHDLVIEIIVVDNNSSDQSNETIKNSFPNVKSISNEKNRGFAAAVNQGLRESKGDYILLLNPDTEIVDNALPLCLKFMKANPDVGILGCKIINDDGTLQPSCRRFPTLLSQIIILLKLHNFFPNLKPIREYYMLEWSHNQIKEVDQVMGAFLLLTKDVLNKVGEFDENFFLWFEEVDYCKRVNNAGFKVIFFPEAKIIHQKGTSFEKLSGIKKQLILNRSIIYYFRKHGKRIDYLIIIILFPVSYLLSILVEVLKIIKIPIKKRRYL